MEMTMIKGNFNKVMLSVLVALGWMLVSPLSFAADNGIQANAEAQQGRMVSGRILDELGQPVFGAVIKNMATSEGVSTDAQGRYTIAAENGQKLLVSMLGYKEYTVTVTSAGVYNVNLEPDNEMLDETVVVGYAAQKKINITGAVSAIKGEDLNMRPVVNVMNALQGADPSMNILTTTGDPVGGFSMNIRGVPSINGGSPLVLVDGVPGVSLTYVNASDIESISVLKDASASAVYGAKASAGVILVTTKSGKDGKTKVSYSNQFGVIQPTTSTDFISNGYDWAKAIDEVYVARYNYSAFNYTEADWAALEARRYDVTENPERPWVVVGNDGQYHYYGNYDWYHALFNNNRFQQQHDLSISGGNKAVKYYISGKFHDEQGLLSGPAITNKENFQSYGFRAKIDAQLFKWAKFTTNASVYSVHQMYPGTLDKSMTIPALDQALGPMFVPRNPDGTQVIYPKDIRSVGVGKGRGAITTNEHNKHDIEARTISLSNSLELTPVKGLSIKATYNISNFFRLYKDRTVAATYSDVLGKVVTNTAYAKDEYRERHYHYTTHSVDGVITYNNTWNNAHNFTALAGVNYETRRTTDLTVDQIGLGSMDLSTFNSVNDDTYYTISQDITAYRTLGFFGRINYDYMGKYLFEASVRADGTSRFAAGQCWGYFPSASAGWRFSKEDFMDGASNWLSDGKVRVSYGSLGNQQVNDYVYLQTINIGTISYLFDGSGKPKYTAVSTPLSSGLTWETVETYNFGLDMSFFNNRLSFTGDYFIRNTLNMLTTSLTLPDTFGANTPKENCANMRTNGWEIQLSWKDSFKLGNKPFHYGVTGTLGDYITTITKYNNPDKKYSDYYVGKTLGEIWGYHVPRLFVSDEEAAAYQLAVHNAANVYQRVYNMAPGGTGYLMAGDVMFEDRNNDGYINTGSGTVADPGDAMIIGNSLPRYNYSFRFDFNWNNFDLSVFLQGVGKRDWYPTANNEDVYGSTRFWNLYGYTVTSFISKDYKDHIWTEENPDGYFPRLRPIQSYGGGPLAQTNDRYLQKVNYLRLKNITLGYTVPFKKSFISSLRVFVSADNIAYWSPLKKYCKTIDPELAVATGTYYSGSGTGYTMPRTIVGGLSINF